MSTEDLTDALKTLRFAMEHHVELLKRANATIRGMSMEEWARECAKADKQQQGTTRNRMVIWQK